MQFVVCVCWTKERPEIIRVSQIPRRDRRWNEMRWTTAHDVGTE